jgi:hypothetical protein
MAVIFFICEIIEFIRNYYRFNESELRLIHYLIASLTKLAPTLPKLLSLFAYEGK